MSSFALSFSKQPAGNFWTILTHGLALAELDLVSAQTTYEKAKVELDRTTGATLEHNGILLQDAMRGVVSDPSP